MHEKLNWNIFYLPDEDSIYPPPLPITYHLKRGCNYNHIGA